MWWGRKCEKWGRAKVRWEEDETTLGQGEMKEHKKNPN
jgi:hypothetical protein